MDLIKRKVTSEYISNLEDGIENNKKKQFFKKLPFVFLAIFVILGFIFFTKASNFFSVINGNIEKDKFLIIFPKDEAEENLKLFKDENRRNFLLLGIRGEDDLEHGGLLTDTIMVVSIDMENKKAALISVPRDLYLKIPGTQRKEKINAAYSFGEEKLEGGGIELSKRTVEFVTGLFIDNVISFDFAAFKEIVDKFGGIDIYLDKEFSENKQWGNDFYVGSGWQHLNGDIALYYARSRFSTNDFDRARRQQQILLSVKNKALKLGFLTNPFKVNSILEILQNRIKTDITIFDIIKYSRLIQNIENDKIRHKVFSTESDILTQTYINGAYVLLPRDGNLDEIRKISREILN